MDNNIKFTLIINILNQKISDLNIKISKDTNNNNLKQELDTLLKDRDLLYNGNITDVENLIKKYGDTINE